mmetsp:Transcript_19758/g.29957  ORF Transcript_19758/g.29957 Transcript_19758/m.29957 type:complete len:225 (-) Transcript_19758:204-878(-)
MMLLRRLTCFILLKVVVLSLAQQYQEDYPGYHRYADGSQGSDNLYHNYAQHQDRKYGNNDGGLGWPTIIMSIGGTWLASGYFHGSRAKRSLKERHKEEQEALHIQHYKDVYKFMETNQELLHQVDSLTNEVLDAKDKAANDEIERDYEEFQQPDIDGDDRISRAEFGLYVKNYLSNYPGLQEKDYPKFEDFDHDGDGYVGFQEYAHQMALQVKQAEQDLLDSNN